MTTQPPTPKPHLQVLALGYPKTGTASIQAALTRLGYHDTCHGFDVISRPQDLPLWTKACDAKWYGSGEALTRTEWDVLLGRCAAVTDMPCAFFADELLDMYPDAKVILVQRDAASWYRSFSANVVGSLYSRTAVVLRKILDTILGTHGGGFFPRLVLGNFRASDQHGILRNAVAVYNEHYDHVRARTPPEQLLNYELRSGWGPLCEFLGKEVPKEEFPRLNEEAEFKRKIIDHQKRKMKAAGVVLLKYCSPLFAVGAVYYLSKHVI